MRAWWPPSVTPRRPTTQTRAAIDAGATVGTHLFNAMRPIDRREPGPIIALLEDPRVTVELITDGVHVDPAIYRHVTRSAGPDRVSLMTDAMAATGMADGVYHLGPLAVDVVGRGGPGGGTQTPSQAAPRRMDRVFRFAVTHSGLPRDEALMLAVRQSSINPARALGLPSAGLVPGRYRRPRGAGLGPRRDGRAAPGIVGRRAVVIGSACARDEFGDDAAQLGALLLLNEVSGASHRGVVLAAGAGDPFLKNLLPPSRWGIPV